MFNASLQETLARYSDPSRNPYVRVLRSQPSEPKSSQHLAQPLRPGLDSSFDVPPANQWRPRLRLDIEAAERPLGGTLQVLDSRGCYIQSLSLRTRSQPRVQQVLPAYPNVVTSSHVELYAVPYGAAGVIEHEPLVSDVAPRPRSTGDATNVLLTPASTMQRSTSGSYTDPIIISDIPHAPVTPEISRPVDAGNMATENEKMMEKGDAERTETERHELATNESKRMETERHELATNESKRMETERHELATNEAKRMEMETHESATNEAKQTESERCESVTIERSESESRDSATNEAEKMGTKRYESAIQLEAERTRTETRELATKEAERTGTETRESVANETTTKKEPRTSTTTNTSRLLRIERKLNNKDLFMGSYRSESSSELRYPHECIAPKIGDIYVHCFKKEGNQKFQLWVRQISRGMTVWVKAHIFHIHPKLVDRRLTLSTTGEPYWATRTSLMASGSRERAGRVAEMILYS